MAVEVRCGCGQLVYAEERFAGQHVQCPHCRAAVAVPVAPAAAAPPPAPPLVRSFWNTETGRMVSMIIAFVTLSVAVGYIKSCREEAEKSRPDMGELMKKARDKHR
jgi:hypothetical protein